MLDGGFVKQLEIVVFGAQFLKFLAQQGKLVRGVRSGGLGTEFVARGHDIPTMPSGRRGGNLRSRLWFHINQAENNGAIAVDISLLMSDTVLLNTRIIYDTRDIGRNFRILCITVPYRDQGAMDYANGGITMQAPSEGLSQNSELPQMIHLDLDIKDFCSDWTHCDLMSGYIARMVSHNRLDSCFFRTCIPLRSTSCWKPSTGRMVTAERWNVRFSAGATWTGSS